MLNKNTQPQLYPVSVWEKAKPSYIEFDHILFTKDRKVRLVHGTIQLLKKTINEDGTTSNLPYNLPVRWDAFGRCWRGSKSQKRIRDYDIKLVDNSGNYINK